MLSAPAQDYTRRLLAAEPTRWSHPWTQSRPTPGAVLAAGHHLAKNFGDKALFTGLDVAVHAGERLALTGPSGTGKTTLGNILLRLLPPDAGRVEHATALRGGKVQKLYQDRRRRSRPGCRSAWP